MRALLTFLLCAAVAGFAQSASHIEAHVPAVEDFRMFLVRDVSEYLSKKEGRELRAECELLRDAPTQSGVAYPKFYVWVRGVDAEKKTVVEGVTRLAAIDKRRFEVTDFISKSDIVAAPDRLDGVFPPLLVPKIKEKADAK
jgi:hypothetical protein